MTTTRTRLTYTEYLNEPETMLRFDIVDGEVIMSAGPQHLPSTNPQAHFQAAGPFRR